MNGLKEHSTLRELRAVASSRNFWIVLSAIVILFTVIGPFGSIAMPVGPRFGFWLINLVISTWIAMICVVVISHYLELYVASSFVRVLAGSLFSCLPNGVYLMLLIYSWHGTPLTLETYLTNVAQSLPLSLVFTLIFRSALTDDGVLAAAGREPAAVQPPSADPSVRDVPVETRQPTNPEPPALLSRLKPENRAPVLRLSAEDHYTLTVTTRGRELVLIRFSDALAELGATEGVQIHRSHWVARAAFEGLETASGKLMLRLKDGTMLPVSRGMAGAVKQTISGWT